MIRKIASWMIIVLLSSATAHADPQTAETYDAGGIAFKVPTGWVQTEPRTSMRLFQFEAPSPKAGERAVMAVFYFGQDQGGSIDANIERWKGQFTRGQEDAAPVIEKTKTNNIDVTTVYLEGTYDGGMGFSGTKPDYAALGGIAEGREGPVFFKMTGPKSAIQDVRNDFDALVRSFRQ